ncbi:MAG: circadian clock protein KaiB [Flavisolibacter sp.]
MATKDKAPEQFNSERYIMELYITGASPNSIRAITNLKRICEINIKGKYNLKIIDVYQQGLLAKSEQIIALPMLIIKYPLPERRLIGDMSNTDKVLKGLGLQ